MISYFHLAFCENHYCSFILFYIGCNSVLLSRWGFRSSVVHLLHKQMIQTLLSLINDSKKRGKNIIIKMISIKKILVFWIFFKWCADLISLIAYVTRKGRKASSAKDGLELLQIASYAWAYITLYLDFFSNFYVFFSRNITTLFSKFNEFNLNILFRFLSWHFTSLFSKFYNFSLEMV